MTVQALQARVRGRVWQAIAQSGVNLSAIPQAEMEQMVSTITEGVLLEMDQVLEEGGVLPTDAAAAAVPSVGEGDEEILWEGRPFLSLGIRYQITNERIRIVEGMMGKTRQDIELVRVQDIDQRQSVGERMANLGDLYIKSHDPTNPELVLHNISNPESVHEVLRRAVLNARKRHNLHYREQM